MHEYFCGMSQTPVPSQVVYELPATTQWIFECQWCPRNPSIISTASFDGHVTMYSLLGGGGGGAKGAESGAEQAPAPPPPSGGSFFDGVTAQVAPRSQVVETAPLKTPPKWFRRPCGARFAVSTYTVPNPLIDTIIGRYRFLPTYKNACFFLRHYY